jgi:acyl carrier protein
MMEDTVETQATTDLTGWITERVAAHLRVPPDSIRPDVPLAEYGLDSVYALAVCGEIEDHLGRPVDATVMWDYPTIDELSAHLLQQPVTDR